MTSSIKVSSLVDDALDLAVLYSRYGKNADYIYKYSRKYHRYSLSWKISGPLLSSERISRTIDHSGLWIAYYTDGYTEGDEGKLHMHCDRSELIAGLRCYVGLNFGEKIELPKELLYEHTD
jgi:hypothetical protein